MAFCKEKQTTSLPPHSCPHELANKFGNYFCEKIRNIQVGLEILSSNEPSVYADPTAVCISTFSEFDQLTHDAIKKLVMSAPTKSSILDPIPTWLLKECIEELAPYLTLIVNQSLQSGCMPLCMKEAVITPLIKKQNLEPVLKNYRPVSNLSFVSKLIE